MNGFLSIISPFIIGAALAFILNVPMRAFENLLSDIKKPAVRRLLAVVLTFVSFLLVLAIVFWLLIPQIIETVQTLVPQLIRFVSDLEKKVNEFLIENPEMMKWVTENTDLENLDWAALLQKAITMVGESVSTILSRAFSAIGSIAGAVVDSVIGVVFALYCLFRKEILARQGRRLVYAFLPERGADNIVRILRLTNSTFSNFLSGQCVEVCILGGMFAVSMAIFGMPYIPLVSVLVAVTAFIPLVGAFVGCIFGAFFIMVNDPLMAVWFVIMFLVIQQIEGNLIYPRVVGTSIGLPGMWVLVAVAFGGEVMGIAGMFLMIPLASVAYALLGEFTGKRLEKKNIDPAKLQDQPILVQSRFKQNRERKKMDRLLKRKKAEPVEQQEEQ
ncbi:MAG: AI-2E family transporter [Oscillospiraceae bacterium]|nr:AI-2E family transporter [Oscillospiraceae bacterium]